jgi:nucleotide-binding universal stress UspA family protein
MTTQSTAFKNILFPLSSYPAATSASAVERAVAIADRLGAHLSAVAFEMDVRLPAGVYADVYSLGDIIAAEYQRGSSNAHAVVSEFRAAASRQGISHEQRVEQCVPAEIAERTIELAHVNDLSLVAVKKDNGGQRDIIESLLFGSGRPVLLFPEACAEDLAPDFEKITVAWDNKAPATRAVTDALPFLRGAKAVRLVVVENEQRKAGATQPTALLKSAYELARLARHGVEALVADIDAKGDAAGDVLVDDILKNKADMLVMGAYGHARLKEVVLGGTTDTILSEPPGYVLMSR